MEERTDEPIKVSIVVLTFNRPQFIKGLATQLSELKYRPLEIIIVDNHSDESAEYLAEKNSLVRVIRTDENLGVGGRNVGMKAATGSIIITLDDDVYGLNDNSIQSLLRIFSKQEIGAVCFKVLDAVSDEIINWCHHYKLEDFHDKSFLTNEITEGAVAIRKKALDCSGFYPERFFISHEGPDLAFRIMNCNYEVIYSPEIAVKHHHAPQGRPNWRRYYYDTRNLIWLVLRNYPFFAGCGKLFIGLSAMLVYSLRDGFFKYWLKALFDGLKATPEVLRERTIMSENTRIANNKINSFKPGFVYMLKKRLFSRKIRI